MKGTQNSTNKDHYDNEEDQFEIKDFRETLTKCVEDADKTYGQKSKPRNQEPSMFSLLSWKDDEEALYNYTKKDKDTVNANIYNKLKYKINKSSSHWATENMDQFRKFTYSPTKKTVFFDLEDPKSKLGTSTGISAAQGLAESLEKSHKDHDVYVKELPKKASEALDKYTIQELKNLKDVLKVIENRAINKGGEIVKNPIAEQIAGQLEHQYNHENAQGDVNEIEEQGQDDQEPSEEDIKVEKMDFSNVQSRLLTQNIRKAKELDPIYEKDRLKRREERIQKLNETTRWLPNSAFKTYFGKAPFENYGRGNINPTVGGPIYGDYLKSHNINPHSGDNKPEYKQIYSHADFAATRYPPSQPQPPRKCKDEIRLSQKQVEELKRRNPLVAEKFNEDSKKIVKPDLVNSLRFASEENTPEASFEQEKKSKPKNLGESLKQLSKKARVLREETAKQTESETAKRNKSEPKNKKQEKAFRATQDLLRENEKTASAKKVSKDTVNKAETRKGHPQSEGKQVKAKSKNNDSQGFTKNQGNLKATSPQKSKDSEDHDIAQEFNFSGQGGDSKKLRSATKGEVRESATYDQYSQQKGRSNMSQGVKDLMQDPSSAFNDKLKETNKGSKTQDAQSSNSFKGNQIEKSTKEKKEVTFKQAPEVKSASKSKEVSASHPLNEGQERNHPEYGKVEDLQTLLKETQKNEKLWDKINGDTEGTLAVNPMEPPKNYLFSLAQKETDPRYYKNVPAVWLQRIPYAGRKNPKSEDIKGVFNYSD